MMRLRAPTLPLLAVLAPLPSLAAAVSYPGLQVSGNITTTGFASDLAAGLAQPAVTGSCYLNVNGFGPASYCGGYTDTSSSDIGYYFGLHAGSGGGSALEVDNATNGSTGGWGINPTNQFLQGSGNGSAAYVLLNNANPGSPYQYNGMQIDSDGTTNLFAAVAIAASGATIYSSGIVAHGGIATDGIGDHSNAITDVAFNASHPAGLLVDSGAVLRQGLLVVPSDPWMAGTTARVAWAPRNGSSTAGVWILAPQRADFSGCGLCLLTPAAPRGGLAEVDATAGGGIVATGAVSYGSPSGASPAVVEQLLSASGTSTTLTPDGASPTTADNASAIVPTMLAANGTPAPLPSAGQTVSMTVLCSGGTSVPNLVSVRAYVPQGGSGIVQVVNRLAGSGPVPSVQLAVDPATRTLRPTVTSTAATTCVASLDDLIIPGG